MVGAYNYCRKGKGFYLSYVLHICTSIILILPLPSMLQIHDLDLRFGKQFRLQIPHLVLEKAVTILRGPNGSGKSTLLHAILGLEGRKRGTFTLGGQRLHTRRNEIKFALSSLYYPDSWCYAEAKAMAQAAHTTDPLAELRQDLEAKFGIPAFAHKAFANLSAGMRQKANLCLALQGKPALLLLDEPEVHLDDLAQEHLLFAANALLDFNIQIVCATHYAQPWADIFPEIRLQTILFPYASNS